MTRDDIIKMAREAGFNPVSYMGANLESFERFAELVAAREREACAKVCDEKVDAEYKTGKVEPCKANSRKPLTDDQIALIVAECAASAHRHDDFSYARAIERAHGIGVAIRARGEQ